MPRKSLKDFEPEQLERFASLLRRSDTLSDAYAIVHDTTDIRPERKAELLEDLGAMSEEADGAVERCRAELGFPKPTE